MEWVKQYPLLLMSICMQFSLNDTLGYLLLRGRRRVTFALFVFSIDSLVISMEAGKWGYIDSISNFLSPYTLSLAPSLPPFLFLSVYLFSCYYAPLTICEIIAIKLFVGGHRLSLFQLIKVTTMWLYCNINNNNCTHNGRSLESVYSNNLQWMYIICLMWWRSNELKFGQFFWMCIIGLFETELMFAFYLVVSKTSESQQIK